MMHLSSQARLRVASMPVLLLSLTAGALGAASLEPPIAPSPARTATSSNVVAPSAVPAPAANNDLAPYLAHLAALIALVDRCNASIDLQHCDSRQVGADDKIQLHSGPGPAQREVHYDWLRDTLTRAVALKQSADVSKPKPADSKPADFGPAKSDPEKPDAASLLAAARLHLVEDQQAVEHLLTSPADRAAPRKVVGAILAEREFDQIEHPGPWSLAVERFFNWLNRILNRIPSGGQSRWVLWTFEWGLVIAAATGLAWRLIQGSKRERWRLHSEGGPPAGAPSLRDWQIWLAEAEALASRGRWREAIHNVYWAAISRLESRGLWPVDRARTPREYLDLIAPADPHRDELTALTGGFERIWYGYRHAAEPEYRSARELLEKLAAR